MKRSRTRYTDRNSVNVVKERTKTQMLECLKQSHDTKPPVGPECLILEFLQIMQSRDSTILVGNINFIVSVFGSYIV